MEKEQEVLLTHGDSVDTVPENFMAVAHSGSIIAGTLSLTLLHTTYKFASRVGTVRMRGGELALKVVILFFSVRLLSGLRGDSFFSSPSHSQ